MLRLIREYSELGNIPFKAKTTFTVCRRKGKFPNKGRAQVKEKALALLKINLKF